MCPAFCFFADITKVLVGSAKMSWTNDLGKVKSVFKGMGGIFVQRQWKGIFKKERRKAALSPQVCQCPCRLQLGQTDRDCSSGWAHTLRGVGGGPGQ